VHGDAADLEGGDAGRRRDLVRALQVLEQARDLLQEERLADAGRAREEDVAAGPNLLEHGELLIGAALVGRPDLRRLGGGGGGGGSCAVLELGLDVEAALARAVARDARRRDGEPELAERAFGELLALLLAVVPLAGVVTFLALRGVEGQGQLCPCRGGGSGEAGRTRRSAASFWAAISSLVRR